MNIKYKDNQVKEIQFDEILIRQQVEIKDIFGYYCYFGFYFRYTSISECCYSDITIFCMWHVWIIRRYETYYFSVMHVFPLSHLFHSWLFSTWSASLEFCYLSFEFVFSNIQTVVLAFEIKSFLLPDVLPDKAKFELMSHNDWDTN